MIKLKLKMAVDEGKLALLQNAGCKVEIHKIMATVEIPGDLVYHQTWECQKNTQEMIYIYISVYALPDGKRIICREKIEGVLTRMKQTDDLFVILNKVYE
jgi:hypothetical protein